MTPGADATAARATQVVGVCLVATFVVAVQRTTGVGSYDLWAALVFIPLLVLLSAHLIGRAARIEPDAFVVRVLVLAFVLKVLATLARYWMAFGLYGGAADAAEYDEQAERLAGHYRQLDFSADLGRDLVGTGFIRALTGVLYAVTGPSIFVAYAMYAWMGFWGLYFFYRAFRTAVPDGNRRRYAVLVLLLPSMLFWPSGLGKEAWMTLGLGLASFGAARLLTWERGWLLPLAAGLLATVMVRPHITAAFFAGVAVAVVVARPRKAARPVSPLAQALLVSALLVVGVAIVGRSAEFLGVEEVTVTNVDAAIEDTRERTSQGGSQYEAATVNSPADLPWAAVSVLFRPFPHEAAGGAALVASVEGVALLILVLWSLGRTSRWWRHPRDHPYLILCLVYATLFIYAFSHFSNFGLLTRERVQVLPFVLVFLALGRRRAATAARPADHKEALA
jgi:hypothetical protein